MLEIKSNILKYKPEMVSKLDHLFFRPIEISVDDVLIIGIQLELSFDDEVWYYILVMKNGELKYIEGSESISEENVFTELQKTFDFKLDISKHSWRDYVNYKSEILFPEKLQGMPLFVKKRSYLGALLSRMMALLGIRKYSIEVKNAISSNEIV